MLPANPTHSSVVWVCAGTYRCTGVYRCVCTNPWASTESVLPHRLCWHCLGGTDNWGAKAAHRFSVGIKWGKATYNLPSHTWNFTLKINNEKFEHFLAWNKAIKQQCQNIFSTYSEHLEFLHYKTILISHKWSLKKEWRSKIIFCKDKFWWNKSEEDKVQTGGWRNAWKRSEWSRSWGKYSTLNHTGNLPITESKRNMEMFTCLITPTSSPVTGGQGLNSSNLHGKTIYS